MIRAAENKLKFGNMENLNDRVFNRLIGSPIVKELINIFIKAWTFCDKGYN